MNKINFTSIKNDVNGNPRVVCHYLNFIKLGESYENYDLAVKRANTLKGRKFHNKQYGGGIVFQCFNTAELERKINEFMEEIVIDKR
jgi:hypothetical protein